MLTEEMEANLRELDRLCSLEERSAKSALERAALCRKAARRYRRMADNLRSLSAIKSVERMRAHV